MARSFVRTVCIFLALLLLCSVSLAALAAAGQEPSGSDGLTQEEQELWDDWDRQDMLAGDSNAQNAGEMTPEEEAAMMELLAAIDENPPMEEVDLSNLEPNEKLPQNVTNILLLGLHNRSVNLQRDLTDAVLICSVNRDTGNIKVTSIARDVAVPIPGFKSQRRINEPYKYGGPELLMKTINRYFQLNIQRYVVVNIHGLADIIDALGGLDLEMTRKEATRIDYELRKEPMDKVKRSKMKAVDGVHHVDGMQAVTFSRIRGIDNDLERTRRQRHLLETLLSAVLKDLDLAKLMDLIGIAVKHGQTNLTLGEMIELGAAVLGGEGMRNLSAGGAIMEQLRIPIDKKFGYRNFSGASVIYLSPKNLALSIETIHSFIYGDTSLDN
ncbi:MAG: LCP family protein [Clostridia bacterium]|nr:LCP family protein [Clostridia bacterium]